jgi:hypothetical protein
LDDIIVFSKTKEDNIENLDAVLGHLYRAGLPLNLKKCHFIQESVNYLGDVIYPGKLASRRRTLMHYEQRNPQNTNRTALVFWNVNVYRRFVAWFAKIAHLLNQLLRKKESQQLGELTPEQLEAFMELRRRLLDPPILALPRAEGKFT